MIMIALCGLLMALADSVPGVSGGTIAFIMGFYERFLTALQHLFGKDKALRKEALLYLIKFAAGWIVGMAASVLLLSEVFEKNIYFLSSLFLGLTAAAIPFIIYEERDSLKGKYKNLIFTALGAALVVLLTALREGFSGIGVVNFQSLGILQYGYLILCGMLSISSMLLPGVSGSTMLLILGVYVPVINAAKELMHLQLQYLPGLAALVAGAVIGIIFAPKIIRRALEKFRPQMIYLILGLLLGSLYAIVMGPTTLETPKQPLDASSFSILAFIIGAAVLGVLEFVKQRMIHNEKPDDIQG